MRIQLFGSSLVAVAALVGCGGDDGSHVKVPDAKVFKDAAVDAPHLCGADPTYGMLTFGSMATPQGTGNHFDKLDMGVDTGRIEFFIAARVSMGTTGPLDAIIFDVLQPGTAAAPTPWVTGTPYSFETDATATNSIAADFYMFGDLDQTAMTIQNFYWAQSGSATFTKFDNPPKANTTTAGQPTSPSVGSLHGGTVTMVPLKEVDQMTGDILPGGCTSTVAGMSFYVQQNNTAYPPAMAVAGKDGGTTGDPALDFAIQRVRDFKAARAARAQNPSL